MQILLQMHPWTSNFLLNSGSNLDPDHILWLVDSDLSDTDNIVPFEYTTPINQTKNVKMKEAEQIDQINPSVIFKRYIVVSVR